MPKYADDIMHQHFLSLITSKKGPDTTTLVFATLFMDRLSFGTNIYSHSSSNHRKAGVEADALEGRTRRARKVYVSCHETTFDAVDEFIWKYI